MVLSAFIGFILLAVGGDALVRGAVGVANQLKISPLLTGLVLVGLGTSLPELVTSLNAAYRGAPDLAVGNVIGSNIVNILLILGITAVIRPINADPKLFKRDAPMLAVATLACVFFALTGHYGRITGVVFVLGLISYIIYAYLSERVSNDESAGLHQKEAMLAEPGPKRFRISIPFVILGMIMIGYGADLLVNSSIELARVFGISEAIIGLTIVALGTSLPELATSIMAALKGESDIAFGNIIGSNIFNCLGILGVTAIAVPITVSTPAISGDLYLMLAATLILLFFAFTNAILSRREGALFIAIYAGYLTVLTLKTTGTL
jgi:cation:H+ antiporter